MSPARKPLAPPGEAHTPSGSPAALEARLTALESGRETGEDFDLASLCWLALLGLVVPIALLAWGWWGSA